MNRTYSLILLVAVSGCALLPGSLRRQQPMEESLYRRAILYLDPANERGSLDSARVLLDRYLASDADKPHLAEAVAIRRLIGQAQELERVELMLQQQLALSDARPAPDVPAAARRDGAAPGRADTPRRAEAERPRPSAEAVREIQRLREQLRAANAELELIRKRLSAPKP